MTGSDGYRATGVTVAAVAGGVASWAAGLTDAVRAGIECVAGPGGRSWLRAARDIGVRRVHDVDAEVRWNPDRIRIRGVSTILMTVSEPVVAALAVFVIVQVAA